MSLLMLPTALCGAAAGWSGAIHRAAGPELLNECCTLKGCNTGEAKITGGYRLPAKHVIHTVGPVWHGGDGNEVELLAACYRNSLALARRFNLQSIAFPAISTGVYGYPAEPAAAIAVRTCRSIQQQEDGPRHLIFACFDARTLGIYQRLLKEETDAG